MHNAPTAYNPAAEQTITRKSRIATAELEAAHAAYIDHRENSLFEPSLQAVVDLLRSDA